MKRLIILAVLLMAIGIQAADLSGELLKWHKVTLTFDGPAANESSDATFLNYRLDVTFTNGTHQYLVPGYFCADGNAGETSATSGNKWRVHFNPDLTGSWTWEASFRSGNEVAIYADPMAGSAAGYCDGETGSFDISPTNKTGRDFRARGQLRYVDEHYLQFAGDGRYFIKGGADSPENFLGYSDFDQTPNAMHSYAPHAGDWNSGDPTWKSGKGKNIIGALNYLSGQGMNSVYMVLINSPQGDGNDVWPWTDNSSYAYRRYDCSKLDQWEIVFQHMTHKGIQLYMIMTETENCNMLDSGALGTTRKLYHRELIARFAHHPALMWNLGEENIQTISNRNACLAHIRAVDPYNHPLAMHRDYVQSNHDRFLPLKGLEYFEAPSIQETWPLDMYSTTKDLRQMSIDGGRKWIVLADEALNNYNGLVSDANDYWHNEIRTGLLWGNYMAGGSGVEYIFGAPISLDITCEDWSTREHMWQMTRYALEFFGQHIPFWQMVPDDNLLNAGGSYSHCLAKSGDIYALYLQIGGSASLDLKSSTDTYTVQWMDPRYGGALQNGPVTSITGPNWKSVGQPPTATTNDWVVLVTRDGYEWNYPSTDGDGTGTTTSTSTGSSEENSSHYECMLAPGITWMVAGLMWGVFIRRKRSGINT